MPAPADRTAAEVAARLGSSQQFNIRMMALLGKTSMEHRQALRLMELGIAERHPDEPWNLRLTIFGRDVYAIFPPCAIAEQTARQAASNQAL